MSEHGREDQTPSDVAEGCPVCGAPISAGDRFCAACGASLPAPLADQNAPELDNPWPSLDAASPALPAPVTPPDPTGTSGPSDGGLWILGARPASVIITGVLLVLLAVALLFIGQLDDSGTIVMLSICLAPLALLTIVIGIARSVSRGVMKS